MIYTVCIEEHDEEGFIERSITVEADTIDNAIEEAKSVINRSGSRLEPVAVYQIVWTLEGGYEE